LESMDSLSLNLLTGGNSPDAKPSGVLALRLDVSPSVIASAPLPHFRWTSSPLYFFWMIQNSGWFVQTIS
ncbi:MAG TPA: hypothetical protein V6D33_09110, partial [Cyanophyceae cyanobacterium]